MQTLTVVLTNQNDSISDYTLNLSKHLIKKKRYTINAMILISEAFSMNDSGTSFLIFCFSDPHSLEGRQWAENRTTDPDQEFSFSWSNNFDFHCWGGQSSHLFTKSLGNTREHCCSTTHNDVTIKIFSNINIALKDWVISDFVETGHLFTNDHRLEESLRASKSLRTDCDGLSVRQFICFVILSWCVVSYISQNLPAISAS